MQWGAAAQTQLPFAMRSFDTRGVLFNTFLANLPQACLSISYFALNRLCTSLCFAREWNSHAEKRRGLRVTNPSGDQRNSYFLQLPYRWAIPLTSMSGLLHWLLSQSVFFVRYDIRDRSGALIPSLSKSTCGYSSLSLLVFSMASLTLLVSVLLLFHRSIVYRIPPADHCSLAISAACHPPPDDIEPHLKAVQWGVVRNRYGGDISHCSITSEEVAGPESGELYA
jgi:hypothetical protein